MLLGARARGGVARFREERFSRGARRRRAAGGRVVVAGKPEVRWRFFGVFFGMGAIECTVATAAAVAHGVFLWRGYHALASGAARVGDVSSFIPFLFPVLYVASVYVGNALMAGRKEMSCKASMAIYNLYAAGLSIVMAYLLGREVLERGLSTFTARGTTPALTAAIWVHYHSKFIEYMDTLFMVLRKKKEQITTLHVVHHAEMAPLTWWWMHTGACNNAFGPAINSVIHTAM